MRILHFSDVHLNANNPEATQKLVNRMRNAVREKYGDNPCVDLIVFTGDMIDAGGLDDKGNVLFPVKDGFEIFKQVVIDPLCEEFHLSRDKFVIAPGNHDMDWKAAVDGELDDIQTKLESSRFSDSMILELYESYVENDKTPWMKSFVEFRDSLYGGFLYHSFKACASLVVEIGGKRVGISMLNCAWAALRGIRYVPVCIEQIRDACDWLKEQNCVYRIAIMHNPMDTLCEDERLAIRREITTEYNLFLSGHMHQEDDYGITDGSSSAVCCVAPKLSKSALSEHDERYKNGFLVVDENWVDYVGTTKFDQKPNHTFAVDANYGENGTKQIRRPEKRKINGISELFALREQLLVGKFQYLHNAKIDDISQKLRNKDIQFIRLSAMPGFGKTRLLYDTFWSIRDEMAESRLSAFYCEDCTDESAVYKELQKIAQPDMEGLIILDNCQRSFIEKVVNNMSLGGTRYRLIAVDNDPYDFTSIPQCEPIMLEPNVLANEVDAYIDKNVPGGNASDSVKRDIKMISDGFPFMAFQLVDMFKKGKQVQLADANALVRRMLQVNGHEEDYRFQHILQALALFLPMPTYENDEVAYKFVVGSDEITHLEEKDFHIRNSFYKKAIRRYQSNLLEVTQDWLKVRPFPLAVWLLKDWFDSMEHAELLKIISDIEALPERTAKLLINGMARRLEAMQDNVSAQFMVDKLMATETGSFCSEKVVCSDMGSRLFLAMSTVNPEKVAKCLRYLFSKKDAEWIRANVVGDTRRNLVQVLNKLCFAHESFDDAIIVMAQFASAENEHWANNSMGGLKQIFPILLPDTEVSLQKRVETIGLLWQMGYKQEALSAINVALKNNSFSRMCGAEKFGWHHREAYHPKTNREIWEYWDGCISLLKQWNTEDEQIWGNIQNIVESHVYDWRSFYRMEQYLFPLMDIVLPHLDGEWQKLYDDILRQTKHLEPDLYTDEQKHRIDEQLERLRPKHFVDDLFYANRSVYDNIDKDKVPFEVKVHQVMHPYAMRFIDERIYENADELVSLASKNVSDGLFVRELKGAISDEALSILCANLFDIIKLQGDSAPLYFTNSVLMVFKDKPQVHDLIVDIYEEKLFSVYVRALAIMEDDDLNSYQKLQDRIAAGELNDTYVDVYLNSLWGATHQQLHKLLPSLLDKFPNKIERILDFVTRHRFGTSLMDADMQDAVRELLLKHPFTNAERYMNVEYLSLVEEYLDNHTDDLDFAKQINLKVLNAYQEAMVHNYSECRLYEHLLQEPYQSAIWDDFTKAFEGDKGVLVFLQLQYEIGSGFTFGAGSLFKYVSAERLKEWGGDSKQVRHYLASMAPVFHYEDGRQQSRFSDFIMWLLDEYGDDEEVISGVSSNINTYSWVGSQYELHEDMIKTYESLLNHHKPRVREWAEREIVFCKKSIEQERSRDDYMRMHYS